MKILLVRPPFEMNHKYKPQPMGLASIAGFARCHFNEAEIRILDALPRQLTWKQTAEEIIREAPQVVGLTIKTPQAMTAGKLTETIKKSLPGTLIIHGGNHVTAMPEESIKVGADIAVVGEGEKTFLEILKVRLSGQNDWKTIKGIYYREKERIISTGNRELMSSLEMKSGPDWSLLDLNLYNENIHIHHWPALQVMGSRGCPHHCTFCSSPLTWTHQVRFRHPEDVVEELSKDVKDYKFQCFHFYDDDIISDPAWLKDVAELIIKKRLKIQWHGIARADSLINGIQILPTLKRSGFLGFALGYEGGTDAIYQRQQKLLELPDLIRAVILLRDLEFPLIELLLMNCYPGETISSMIRSANIIRDLKNNKNVSLHTSRYYATPFPGTGFYDIAKSCGLMLAEHYGQYFCHYITFLPYSFLESPVNYLHLDEEVYPNLIRLSFTENGEYNTFLDQKEIDEFFSSIGAKELVKMMNKEMEQASSFFDFANNWRKNTGISQRSVLELGGKILIHAASFGMLHEERIVTEHS